MYLLLLMGVVSVLGVPLPSDGVEGPNPYLNLGPIDVIADPMGSVDVWMESNKTVDILLHAKALTEIGFDHVWMAVSKSCPGGDVPDFMGDNVIDLSDDVEERFNQKGARTLVGYDLRAEAADEISVQFMEEWRVMMDNGHPEGALGRAFRRAGYEFSEAESASPLTCRRVPGKEIQFRFVFSKRRPISSGEAFEISPFGSFSHDSDLYVLSKFDTKHAILLPDSSSPYTQLYFNARCEGEDDSLYSCIIPSTPYNPIDEFIPVTGSFVSVNSTSKGLLVATNHKELRHRSQSSEDWSTELVPPSGVFLLQCPIGDKVEIGTKILNCNGAFDETLHLTPLQSTTKRTSHLPYTTVSSSNSFSLNGVHVATIVAVLVIIIVLCIIINAFCERDPYNEEEEEKGGKGEEMRLVEKIEGSGQMEKVEEEKEEEEEAAQEKAETDMEA